MDIVSFYHLLFYHIYKSFINQKEHQIVAFGTAIMVLTLILVVNILTIAAILDFSIPSFRFSKFFEIVSKSEYVILLIGSAFINYLYFRSNDRARTIIKHRSNIDLKTRKKGARITFIYGVGSIIAFFLINLMRGL